MYVIYGKPYPISNNEQMKNIMTNEIMKNFVKRNETFFLHFFKFTLKITYVEKKLRINLFSVENQMRQLKNFKHH